MTTNCNRSIEYRECYDKFTRKELFRKYVDVHNLNLQEKKKGFKNIEDFRELKKKVEKEYFCFYRVRTAKTIYRHTVPSNWILWKRIKRHQT